MERSTIDDVLQFWCQLRSTKSRKPSWCFTLVGGRAVCHHLGSVELRSRWSEVSLTCKTWSFAMCGLERWEVALRLSLLMIMSMMIMMVMMMMMMTMTMMMRWWWWWWWWSWWLAPFARWKGFHRIGFTWVRWIYIAVHDVHVMFVWSWLTGRRIGKTSASIGASLLFPFLSARECKIWAGFWARQVCWQSQHEKTCIQSVPESSKTHYSDSPNVKRTCVSPKQISDTLQLSIWCCRHHNADVSHAMHWHPEHDFNMKYWNNYCHVMSCHVC